MLQKLKKKDQKRDEVKKSGQNSRERERDAKGIEIRIKLLCSKMNNQMIDILSHVYGFEVNKKIQNKKCPLPL